MKFLKRGKFIKYFTILSNFILEKIFVHMSFIISCNLNYQYKYDVYLKKHTFFSILLIFFYKQFIGSIKIKQNLKCKQGFIPLS